MSWGLLACCHALAGRQTRLAKHCRSSPAFRILKSGPQYADVSVEMLHVQRSTGHSREMNAILGHECSSITVILMYYSSFCSQRLAMGPELGRGQKKPIVTSSVVCTLHLCLT